MYIMTGREQEVASSIITIDGGGGEGGKIVVIREELMTGLMEMTRCHGRARRPYP